MRRTIDENGFHTADGERFWSRPLYGPNRRCFVPTGELPHASFLWFHPEERAYVRCGHLLPGVISNEGGKWLYQAASITATYDPGMMRFVVSDPTFRGEIRLHLVPLTPGDGYVMRLTPAARMEIAFAFGGFWCLPDKDPLQGINIFPGGIIAGHCQGSRCHGPRDNVSTSLLPKIIGRDAKPLDEHLEVLLITDRPTRASLQEARDGISLERLLSLPAAGAPVQVQRVALDAEESLHLVCLVPKTDNPEAEVAALKGNLAEVYSRCEARVREISHRITLKTPDTLVDLAARSLSVSLDALWVPPTFMHGPIRWGWSGLAGWRMAYGSTVCGTYDRTVSHCKYYGDHRCQGGLDRKPRADPARLFTTQAEDSGVFTEGRLATGTYNMTEMWLAFIAHYYDWTGDRAFLRAMWPAIRDAVGYQKRVMDMDNDSLYENYANTYISDAHWHSGAGCAQASAYTYRGNLIAAEAARAAGESPEPYLTEAARIKQAMDNVLWVKDKGFYAEFKDVLGEKLRHEEPELGSVYLPIDYGIADPFQAYQMLRFTEWGLPNYRFEETGPQLFDGLYRTGSTYEFPQPLCAREVKSSNWRPIVYTTHECSPGEMMDLARAYYRLGLSERAFPLIKAVLRCMVNLTTPGGLCIRDRNREQPARSWANGDIDHCDTLGPSLQVLAEGLFGLRPRLSDDLLEIQPGFPADWTRASIELKDISCAFRREGNTDTYEITTSGSTIKRLRLALRGDGAKVTVNGQPAQVQFAAGITQPFVEVEAPRDRSACFLVMHQARPFPTLEYPSVAPLGLGFEIACKGGSITEVKDPQGVFAAPEIRGASFCARVAGRPGPHTAFLKVKGQTTECWQPVDVEVREPLRVVDAVLAADAEVITFAVENNDCRPCNLQAVVECGGAQLPLDLALEPLGKSASLSLPLEKAGALVPGLNLLRLLVDSKVAFTTRLDCWDLLRRSPARKPALVFGAVDISRQYNDNLALVHTHQYLTPRSPYCSLMPGVDLFREWCCFSSSPCGVLDLSHLADALTRNNGLLLTPHGIPFSTSAEGSNVVFVSQWDNFPRKVNIPVNRAARHVYLLMASVTNPMQSGVVNGRVTLELGDGTCQALDLVNPGNLSWCVDNYPNRHGPLYMTEPKVRLGEHVWGTLYSMPLLESAKLSAVIVEAVCNESVIGLMGVTVLQP